MKKIHHSFCHCSVVHTETEHECLWETVFGIYYAKHFKGEYTYLLRVLCHYHHFISFAWVPIFPHTILVICKRKVNFVPLYCCKVNSEIQLPRNNCCMSVSGPGSLHWESAELGPQQAVGCGCGLPSRVCPHADEAVSGKFSSPILIGKRW